VRIDPVAGRIGNAGPSRRSIRASTLPFSVSKVLPPLRPWLALPGPIADEPSTSLRLGPSRSPLLHLLREPRKTFCCIVSVFLWPAFS